MKSEGPKLVDEERRETNESLPAMRRLLIHIGNAASPASAEKPDWSGYLLEELGRDGVLQYL